MSIAPECCVRLATRVIYEKKQAILIQSTMSLDMCDTMCDRSHMATNLSIEPELLERALEVSGEKTKKAAVTQALVEYIARRERAGDC